jgi:hypothetical protein
MSFFRVCKTYDDYACDPYFDLMTASASSLAAVAPLIRDTIQQTFVALRMRERMSPYLESILKSHNFDKLIADETDRFLAEPHIEFYNSAFLSTLRASQVDSPTKIVFDNDNVLRYMIGNINLGMPMLLDVIEVIFLHCCFIMILKMMIVITDRCSKCSTNTNVMPKSVFV